MIEKSFERSASVTGLAAELVASYVANTPVPASELSKLIESVHGAIAALASGNAPYAAAAAEEVDRPTPAQIRKSVRHDGIISFIDGKTYKTMKRHLTSHSLDPRSYRKRYGLPADYPMVAPSYAEQRSVLARAIGLGRQGARLPEEEPTEEVRAKPRGRRKA
ncbi:MucR family transcriptional regulator [Methylobacterium sp. NMS14P]|uniref:MucR family transcriptional regulator n=1 Tax=Methylobacterium sp. NMS14P TaxID=2894310 RepID=UPI002359CE91|nr:MucR family transcriptional regulator [Methylobacterium sp. NMS14P]WCS25631.1 MucR family transcriptional regulator [Methylobacterium sp. NMS14P]